MAKRKNAEAVAAVTEETETLEAPEAEAVEAVTEETEESVPPPTILDDEESEFMALNPSQTAIKVFARDREAGWVIGRADAEALALERQEHGL